MNNTLKQTVACRNALLAVAITLAVFLAAAHGPGPDVSGQGGPSDQNTPIATIDKIVVGESERNQIDAQGNVTVTRANGENVPNVTTGLLLFSNDVIETKNAKVTVLFLDSPVSERHNQIIIDVNAKVGISSSNSWWGRTWVKVKGIFTSRTTYVQVGAPGTEYEFDVSRDGRQATVVMLEGTRPLEVTRGTFSLVGRLNDVGPNQSAPAARNPQIIPASFRRENGEQQQPSRAFNLDRGEIATYDVTYSVFSDCRQSHRFEFRTSDNTPWLQLEIQRRWDLAPARRLEIKAKVTIDARQLPPGSHQGHVYFVCLDCTQERLCPDQQLDWPYTVTVGGTDPTPRPSPLPSPSLIPSQFRLNELQQALIPNSPEPAGPEPASETRVRSVLDWTNRVILKTQPTYSAEGLIPHYSSVEQRSQTFPQARENAILRRSPGSNKIVGDIYSDWGQPGQAAKAYEKETSVCAPPQGFAVDRAEAQRLIGQLDQAREAIRASADSRSAAAQNLLGNIYYDYARIYLDKRDWAQARTNLDQAEGSYRSALSALTLDRQRTAAVEHTVQANLAETLILQGDLILQQAFTGAAQINAAEQARQKYDQAKTALGNTTPAESTYPFGVQALGRAYQGSGNAAALAGQPAADFYANAKNQFNRIISAHPDCAEAYFSLGDLYDDLGDKENAKLNYRKAIQTRPEQPASYYPLAMHLQTEDPRLAAALAAVYLKLEPEVFKQGDKAENAGRVARGEPVPRVPGVLNKLLAQATRDLNTAGYRDIKIERRSNASAADTVIDQTPAAGTSAPRGSAVKLIVSSGPGTPTSTVPSVVSMTENDAVNTLKTEGFVANVQTRTDSRFGSVVIEQKPVAGSPAPRGSTVDIVVNKIGLIVPDVLSKTEAQAKALIESAGLRLGNVGKRKDPKAAGTVLEQKPTGGSSAARDSAIDMIVSLGPPEPIVPDVMRMSEAEARTAIESAGLRVGEVRLKSEENKPKGSVVKQDPSAGRKVAPGSLVKLEVSAGKLVDVPDVINDKEETAKRKITDRGLTVGNVSQRAVSQRERNCDSVGKVLQQNPTPSRVKVEVGTTVVDIVIGSVGDDPVTVPNFVGGNRRDFGVDMREGRFTFARPKTEETDDAPEGTVISQSPPAGTQFARDCPIKIELTVAEPLTPVGNYVGLPEAEARRQVSEARLFAVVRTRESQSQPGMVIDQSPPAGSRVRRSNPVTLVVSVQLITVPEVVTKTLIEAKSILERVGLRLGGVTYVDPPPPVPGVMMAQFGCIVRRQDPIKDRRVGPGTPVNVWVERPPVIRGNQVDCLNPAGRGDR